MTEDLRQVYTLSALLEQRGYTELAKDFNYIRAALDYIAMQDSTYTIFNWLKDTEQNYPEDLKGEVDE